VSDEREILQTLQEIRDLLAWQRDRWDDSVCAICGREYTEDECPSCAPTRFAGFEGYALESARAGGPAEDACPKCGEPYRAGMMCCARCGPDAAPPSEPAREDIIERLSRWAFSRVEVRDGRGALAPVIRDARAEIARLRADVERLTARCLEAEKPLVSTGAAIHRATEDLRSNLAAAERERDRYRTQLEEVATAAASGKDPKQYLATRLPTALQDEIASLTKERDAATAEVERLDAILARCANEVSVLTYDDLPSELNDLVRHNTMHQDLALKNGDALAACRAALEEFSGWTWKRGMSFGEELHLIRETARDALARGDAGEVTAPECGTCGGSRKVASPQRKGRVGLNVSPCPECGTDACADKDIRCGTCPHWTEHHPVHHGATSDYGHCSELDTVRRDDDGCAHHPRFRAPPEDACADDEEEPAPECERGETRGGDRG
jgi:hypothetical protein